jgi:predicted nucleic acid-binding protein
MTFYYLDASAWVKRYCREAGSAQVQAGSPSH